MPMLRRHRPRKDHRARAPKRRKRRNLVKFIPEADSDFALTARNFVSWLQSEPQAYDVSAEQIADTDKAVKEFRDALAALGIGRFSGSHTTQMRMRKDEARTKAEDRVRTLANIIRANPNVTDTKKKLLRIKVRPEKLGKRKCPQSPPRLEFLGSGDGVTGGLAPGSGSGFHVLRFWDHNEFMAITASCEIGRVRRAKPDGAVRIELFFDMIPVGEPVPHTPFERGWPKYLRSFTRSPIEVEYPIPSEPMLFVYWAKWADSSGETSRWSKPCIARVEGWTPHNAKPALPEGAAAIALEKRVETKYVFIQTPIAGELPDGLPGDAVAEQIAALRGAGEHALEAARSRLLDAA